MLLPGGNPHAIAAAFGQLAECGERGVEKPAEPDAFALAAGADQVETVVPIAGPDQRQAMAPDIKTLVESPRTVFE